MFEENENLVTEVTENDELTSEEIVEVEEAEVTEPTEEQPQVAVETFTKEQVDEMIAKKLARKEAKIRREYENKYSRLETVVNTGLGTSNVEEATNKLESFYEKKGISIPKAPVYTERETQLIADGEANDIINAGYEEVVEEVDRLASIGVDNMTQRDKIIFSKLANYRAEVEQENDLRALGIGKEEINSPEFKDYAKKLNPSLSLKEKYEMYSQIKPKKQINQIGSVKSGMTNQIKDHYSQEEIAKLSLDDLDDPQVWEAVRNSMTK